jgi:hypothetical protein
MTNASPVSSYSAGQRWSIRFNLAVSIGAAFALVVMVNYLAIRHFHRFHWTSDPVHRISPVTLQLLKSLTNEVRIIVFFDKRDPLYRPVEALLKEYAFVTPKLRVDYVDYPRDLARANWVNQQYHFSALGANNLVLFDANGKTKQVLQNELSEYDLSGILGGQTNEIRRTAFRGEQLFNAALLSVTEANPRKAYFLQGHREHDPESDEPKEGYSGFGALLRLSNTQFEKLYLTGAKEVPADCDLLLVAGPKDRFLDAELDQIDAYLNRGGRLLALLRSGPATGLERVLSRWSVEVGDNWVMDANNTINGLDLVVTNFTSHDIVRKLLNCRLYLYLPRSIDRQRETRPRPDSARAEELFLTSKTGTALTDIRNNLLTPSPRDRRGAIPLAVAVEKGGVQGVAATQGATRVVVVGESVFLGNTAIGNYANKDFAFMALNWLLDRPQLQGGVGPRPVREYKLIMTLGQRRCVRAILLAGMPGAVLLVGLVVWWRRRS